MYDFGSLLRAFPGNGRLMEEVKGDDEHLEPVVIGEVDRLVECLLVGLGPGPSLLGYQGVKQGD
jgi:hypothetical protein